MDHGESGIYNSDSLEYIGNIYTLLESLKYGSTEDSALYLMYFIMETPEYVGTSLVHNTWNVL